MRRLSEHNQRFFARVHFWLLGFSLAGYLAFVFTLGPGFLSFDIGQKIRALADEIIVVTAIVLGPPATPVVTATPTCVNGSPRIVLNWADDAATTSWDIERDSAPLVTGLTTSGYTDTAVTGTVSYSYVVTAYGPMSPGIATSSAVSATAIDCSTLLPAATVTIQSIGEEDITASRRFPVKVRAERPRITGTTNMPGATVTLSLTRPSMFATLTANANGYFSWKPPRTLRPGRHTLTVTATDPNDSSRTATTTAEFRTYEQDEEEDETDEVIMDLSTSPPFDFLLEITNTESTLKQGERLWFTIKPVRGLLPAESVFQLNLLDKTGKEVFTAPSYVVTPIGRPGFEWAVDIPLYLTEGAYTLEVTGIFGETVVSHTDSFTLLPRPILYLGDRGVVTYAEMASFLGWILFSLLSLLILFLFILLREYWLYLHGIRHITARELRRFGLIAFGKGVRK